jgi:hypothetical protein
MKLETVSRTTRPISPNRSSARKVLGAVPTEQRIKAPTFSAIRALISLPRRIAFSRCCWLPVSSQAISSME